MIAFLDCWKYGVSAGAFAAPTYFYFCRFYHNSSDGLDDLCVASETASVLEYLMSNKKIVAPNLYFYFMLFGLVRNVAEGHNGLFWRKYDE